MLVMTSLVIIFSVFLQRRRGRRGRRACNDFFCDYFRCIFAKEKEFYSANEAYVLTNEEDATKSFNSVNSNNETTFSAITGISARLCGFIQDHNSGLRTSQRNGESNGVGGIVNRKK